MSTYIHVRKIDIRTLQDGFEYGTEFSLTEKDIAKKLNANWLAKEILEKYKGEKSISIGRWGIKKQSCQPILDMIAGNSEIFEGLESLYIGDDSFVTNQPELYTQNNYQTFVKSDKEMKFPIQGDYSGVLSALPNLKSLKINAYPVAEGLSFGDLKHEKLQELEIITARWGDNGLTEQLVKSHLPSLKKLILYIGQEAHYIIKELLPHITNDKFPCLENLGLVNSPEEDRVLEYILTSDILPQLKILQLSYGRFTNHGAQLILENLEKLSNLELLNLNYHSLSDPMMKELQSLPFKVEVGGKQRKKNFTSMLNFVFHNDTGYTF